MKFKTLLTTAVTTVLGAAIILPAHAIDGTITFTGSVVATSCTINAHSAGAASATVNLTSARLDNLDEMGDTTGDTNFNIVLSNCTGTTGGQRVAVNFESGATVNPQGRLNTTGSATGVQLAIYNRDSNNALMLGQAPAAGTENITSNSATLPYTVKYHATSASPTAGTVSSSVNYSIAYF
ncbi:fimbrial protein [Pseudomonas sp. GZD-222]|uniref:fimbrial protein n=1 Tax=Pseudomonas sp. GZD-222 TaxID=3404805 RepID=UPI003BB69728